MTAAETDMQHPIIGNVKGLAARDVVQFLGIKYASLNHWFDNARLVEYHGNGLDARRHGPQAISDPSGVDNEHFIIQKALPTADHPGISGTECLNLNIVVPQTSGAVQPLPVFVFIHGGAFITGSNWWPQYDLKRFVQLSVKQNKPIIAININYRLGAPGFLTSEALRNAGFKSNQGHHDQRVALQWVRRYIAGFGGDPKKITLAGESAGGISANRFLYSNENAPSQIVVLSGSTPSLPPMDISAAEQTYQGALKALNFDGVPLSQQIETLSKFSSEDLGKLDQSLRFLPVVDEDTVPFVPSFDTVLSNRSIPKDSPCKAIIVGYLPLDASIFGLAGLLQRQTGIAASFVKSIKSSLANHPNESSKLLSTYGISAETKDETALIHILRFASDIGFQAPARSWVESFPGDSFLLEFAEPNPWDGPFKGHSTHVLDVAFLFQNYNDHLDPSQRASAEAFAADIISFVGGEAPWNRFRDAAGFAVYQDGKRTYKEGSAATSDQYRALLEISETVGLDSLLEAWMKFFLPS